MPDDTAPASAPPSIFDVFQTDPAAEAEGKWMPFASSRFRVRAASSPGFQAIRNAQLRRHAPLLRANAGVLPPDTVAAAEAELAAAAVVDWEGVPVPPWWDAKKYPGGVLPFSAANAKALFADKRMHRLRSAVLNASESYDTFRAAEAEALEGNSANASSGNSASGSGSTP